MKKVVLTFIILIPLCCSAQFEKFTLYTGGTGSFSSQKQKTSSTSGFGSTSTASTNMMALTFSPKIGFFPIDKLLVGPSLSLSVSKSGPSGSFQTVIKNSTVVVGPFVRYYIVRGLFAQAEYAWGVNRNKSTSTGIVAPGVTQEDQMKSTSKSFSAGAGYSILLNSSKSVALEVSMFYRSRTLNMPAANSISTVAIDDNSLVVSIGINGFLHLIATK